MDGFVDYKDIGNLKFNNLVRRNLVAGNDFAIELNLGFKSHYDFLKSVGNFSRDNQIGVILFFADDINICFKRAKIRHERGMHFVSHEVITEMYTNTLDLLKEHFKLINQLTLVNVDAINVPQICLEYNRSKPELSMVSRLPHWAEIGLKQFLIADYGNKSTGR